MMRVGHRLVGRVGGMPARGPCDGSSNPGRVLRSIGESAFERAFEGARPCRPHLESSAAPLQAPRRPLIPRSSWSRARIVQGDIALELQVVARMVLGADRQGDCPGRPPKPIRDSEETSAAVALQTQVPVQPGGAVLR